jgi:hypothetical protein
MYDVHEFTIAEMSSSITTYKRFAGRYKEFMKKLVATGLSTKSLYFLHDPGFQYLIDSGYSVLLRRAEADEWLFENTHRPCDNEAKVLIVDMSKIVYINTTMFYTTYKFGSVKQTIWNYNSIFGITAACGALLFLTLKRVCRT